MPIIDRFSSLSDTNVSTPADGQTLVRAGGLWANQSIVAALAGNAALASGGGVEKVATAATVSAATYTINLANGNVFPINLSTARSTAISFSGATAGKACSFTLYLKQPASATRTVTWGSAVKWSGGAPTLSAGSGKMDILVFETIDGGTTWYGSLVGINFV